MVNSKISPCLWNWIAKLNCEWRVIVKSWKAFHLVSQWFCLCEVSETKVMLSFNLLAIFTVKCNDSVSFYCLVPLFSLFFVMDQNLCFWTKCSMCPYISLRDCGRVWISAGSEYCMQLIVWTLNTIYNRKEFSNSVSCSVSCWHLQMIFLGLPLESRLLLFACFWEIVNAGSRNVFE